MAITLTKRKVRLNHYYPNTVYPSKEFESLSFLGDMELNDVWDKIWQWMLNTFVYDLDAQGASRWESMLGIRPEAFDTLNTRKRRILAKINSAIPYTERSFQAMLDNIYGEDAIKLKVLYNNYAIALSTTSKMQGVMKEVRQFARAIIPANLEIFLESKISLKGSTYSGGRVVISKYIKLVPAEDFSGVRLRNKIYRGGIVRFTSYLNAKATKQFEGAKVNADKYYGGRIGINGIYRIGVI